MQNTDPSIQRRLPGCRSGKIFIGLALPFIKLAKGILRGYVIAYAVILTDRLGILFTENPISRIPYPCQLFITAQYSSIYFPPFSITYRTPTRVPGTRRMCRGCFGTCKFQGNIPISGRCRAPGIKIIILWSTNKVAGKRPGNPSLHGFHECVNKYVICRVVALLQLR